MPEISGLRGNSDWIDLNFVERERTPEPAMALGIQSNVAGLSLSNTVELLASSGVQRSRKAIHDWVQKADLQPDSGRSPNQIALDETVIRINDQHFWLYAASDPETNDLLHVRLFSTTTTALTEIFLRELRQKHEVENTVFLVDGAQHLQTALQRAGLRFQMRRHGNRNAIERAFRELKRRTSSFSIAPVTPNQKPPNREFKPPISGTTPLTKHDPNDAQEFDDNHSVRFTNQVAEFDRSPVREYEFTWWAPKPGDGTNFWIPLRINPEQEGL